MTWRVFLTDSSQPDLDRLTPADRAALTDELFAWVSDGPPRTSSQVVAGIQMFEDQLPSGISVTYFVDERQRRTSGNLEPQTLRLLRGDDFDRATLHHLDAVIPPGEGRTSPGPEVIDDLALGEHPQNIRFEVREHYRRAGDLAGLSPLAFQLRSGLTPLEAQDPRLIGALGPRDDVAAVAELLESEDADCLLAEGSVVTGLRRLEQVAGNLPESLGRHAATEVVDGDDGVSALPAQHDSDSLAASARLDVLVSGVRHEFVERILRILVSLSRYEDGFRKIADP